MGERFIDIDEQNREELRTIYNKLRREADQKILELTIKHKHDPVYSEKIKGFNTRMHEIVKNRLNAPAEDTTEVLNKPILLLKELVAEIDHTINPKKYPTKDVWN